MWRTVKLGDVVSYAKSNAQGTCWPYVGMENIASETMELIGEISIPESTSTTFEFDESHVLFGRLRPYLRKVLVPGFRGQCSTEIFCLKPSRELLREYLAYWLLEPTVSKKIDATSTGARMPRANMNKLLEFDVTLPPLAEQQRIVSKIDAAFAEIDRAIELVNEQILNFDTLLLQLLSFLYFEDGSTIRLLLKDIADVKGGKRLPKGEKLTSENTGFPYIRVTDFNDYGSIDTDAVLFVTAKVQKQISRYTITSKNVYVSIAGTIGKTGIIPETLDNANLTENAAKLVLKEGIDTQYVYYFTKTHSFEQQAIAQTRTAAQPKLALERLSSVELPVPDVKSQRLVAKLARAATDYKSQLVTNRLNKIDLLNTLKSAILAQELQPPQSEAA